jgi:hypothetical protein
MSLRTRGLLLIVAMSAVGCSGPSGGDGTEAAPAAARTYGAAELLAWPPAGDANWRAVDEAVQADAGSGFLVTPQSYADFDLSAEFWVTPDANSGIFLRCADPAAPGADTCYEVNIFDQRPDQTYRTGGIVNLAAPASVVYTGGRWNRFEISAQGPRLRVTLNERPLIDVEDSRLAAGPIALQYGSGTVLFRHVRIAAR